MPRRQPGRALPALVGAAGVAVLVGGTAYALLAAPAQGSAAPGQGSAAASTVPPPPVHAAAGALTGALLPGGSATGTLHLANPHPDPVRLTGLELAPPTTTAPGCRTSAVAFAALTVPTAAAPLVVPGRDDGRDGRVVVRYTAFMDVHADVACRGAALRSDVLVTTAQRPGPLVVGAATATASTLTAPPTPAASSTTGTTAELRWTSPPGLPAGAAWLVERAPYGTSAWTPACGSGGGALSGTACTDTGLRPGRAHSYRVTLQVGRWRATSPPSLPVRTTSDRG